MTVTTLQFTRRQLVVLWILRALLAAIFLLAAVMKLTGQPMMVDEFNTIGFGQWFRYLTGTIELVGGIAILWPSVSIFGAILLLGVDIGAFFTQIAVLHQDWIHTVVLGALLSLVIYLQRPWLR